MSRYITSTKVRQAATILKKKGELGKHDFVVPMLANSEESTYCMMGAIGVALQPNQKSFVDDFKFGTKSKFYRAVSQVFPGELMSFEDSKTYPEAIADEAISAVARFNDKPTTTLQMAVDKLNEIANVMDSL